MEAKLQQQTPQKAQADKPNLTGIPTQMKLDFEQRSGLSFDDVRVHYNSDKSAQLQALAYTQGTQVYVGPGQERHLSHELGHVIQQKMQNIPITSYVNHIPVNTDIALEKKANQFRSCNWNFIHSDRSCISNPVVQGQFFITHDDATGNWIVNHLGRPNFPNYIERIRATDTTGTNSLTKNHLIPSSDISNNINNLLLYNLQSKKPLDPLDLSKMKSGAIEITKGFYALCNMIIPDDGIQFGNESQFGPDVYQLYKSLSHHAYYGISNTRLRALDYANRIANIIACPDGVNIPALIAYSNEFEFILNASLANIRFGDSRNNQTIKRHFDVPRKMRRNTKDEDISYDIRKETFKPVGKQKKNRAVYNITYNGGNIAQNSFVKRFIEAKKLDKVLKKIRPSVDKEGLRFTTPKIVLRNTTKAPMVLSSDDSAVASNSISELNTRLESVELHIQYEKEKDMAGVYKTMKRELIITDGSIEKSKLP